MKPFDKFESNREERATRHTLHTHAQKFSQKHESVLLSSLKHEENYDKNFYFLFVFGTYIKPALNSNAVYQNFTSFARNTGIPLREPSQNIH